MTEQSTADASGCASCGGQMRPMVDAPSFLVCANDKCGAQIDTTPPLGPSTIGMFGVYASKMSDVRAKFASMARKAAKLGLVAPALVEVGATFVTRVREADGSITEYDRTWCVVDGVRPVLADWTLLAVLEHVDGETMTFTLDASRPIPATSRGAAPRCDHCRTSRQRSQTFVVAHDDGRLLHVGRSCLGDFCGDEGAAKNAAALAAMIIEAREALDDADDFGGARGERRFDLTQYLSHVVCAIAEYGWTSKAKADESRPATASRAACSLSRVPKWPHYDPTAEDIARAESVIAWVGAWAEDSEYAENLRVVARLGSVRARHEGFAAAMVITYDRAMNEAAERVRAPVLSVHRGTVGARDYFDLRLVRECAYENDYGVTFIQTFRDAEGAEFVWFGSRSLGLTSEADAPLTTIRATVKKHDTDRKQGHAVTVLTRASIEARPVAKVKRARKSAASVAA